MRLLIALWATLVLATPSTFAAVKIIDRIVATVDEDVVTQSELDSRIREIKAQSTASGMRLPSDDVLREQILDQLINETLQLSTARRYRVTVDDKEVLFAIQNILKNRKWTESDLEAQLKKNNSSFAEFKAQIERQLTMQNLSQGLVRSRIKISEHDIDNFLKSAEAQFWISPDYHLSHILVAQSSASDPKKVEAKAQTIYKKLLKGAKFEEVALAESDGPMALKGGDMGWRKSTDLPTLFAEIAPNLAVGDISAPAKSGAGFHILKLNNKRGETKQIVNQTKVRHILLKNSAILDDDQAKEKLLTFRAAVLNGEEEFAKLAKVHSEDIGSKLSGGDLGWSTPGQFVPSFEATMAKTNTGELSQPFKSRFGWHMLYVEDRREEDMTDKAIRQKAHNVLMSRRFEDEVQLWIQEMRDDAFIELKI